MFIGVLYYLGGGLNPLKLQLKWRADLQVRWIDQRIEPTTYYLIMPQI